MVRVIIAGSRGFNDYKYLETKCLKAFYLLSNEYYVLSGHIKEDLNNIEIISGTAKGADTLGEQFAFNYGIKVKRFPANWNAYGKSAGYIRNEQMAKYAVSDGSYGVLIAFWDGKSKGTKHMIDIAKKQGLTFIVVGYVLERELYDSKRVI